MSARPGFFHHGGKTRRDHRTGFRGYWDQTIADAGDIEATLHLRVTQELPAAKSPQPPDDSAGDLDSSEASSAQSRAEQEGAGLKTVTMSR
jgi:hypothetical protein